MSATRESGGNVESDENRILTLLRLEGIGLRPSEIMDWEGIPAARVQRTLRRLVKQGILLHRTPYYSIAPQSGR